MIDLETALRPYEVPPQLPTCPAIRSCDDEPGPFPTNTLPGVYAEMVSTLATTYRVDSAIPSMVMLATLSAALGRGVTCELLPGYTTQANLYIVVVSPSGSGKSSVATPILKPLIDQDEALYVQWQQEVRPGLVTELKLLKSQERRLMSKSPNEVQDELKKNIRRQIELENQMVEPRLVVEDTTSQQLAILLKGNNESISLLSQDAGDVLNNLLGRYNKTDRVDDSILVRAYSGDPVRVDRVGRQSVQLNKPWISLLLMLQPEKWAAILGNRQLLEGGFVPRCLVAQLTGEVQPFIADTPSADQEVIGRYNREVSALIRSIRLGGRRQVIQATPEARQIITQYCNLVVGDMNVVIPETRSLLSRWGEQACRLSIVLHNAKYGVECDRHPLDEESARAGVTLARWFGSHQIEMCEQQTRLKEEMLCKDVLTYAAKQGGKVTVRDIVRAGLGSTSEIKQILAMCVHRNLMSVTQTTSGGRPKTTYTAKGC